MRTTKCGICISETNFDESGEGELLKTERSLIGG